MQILYLIHSHPSRSIGGAENATLALFDEVQKQDKNKAYLLSADSVSYTHLRAHET